MGFIAHLKFRIHRIYELQCQYAKGNALAILQPAEDFPSSRLPWLHEVLFMISQDALSLNFISM